MSQLILDESGFRVQAFKMPVSGSTTQLTLSGTSAATAALTGGIYRLESDVDCFVALGATALLTDMPIVANVAEYFSVNGTDTIAAIAGGAGTLRLTLV